MRLAGLSWVLLAACSANNPVFGLTNAGPGSEDAGASDGGPTTSGVAPTSAGPGPDPGTTASSVSTSASTTAASATSSPSGTSIGESTADVSASDTDSTGPGGPDMGGPGETGESGGVMTLDPDGGTTLDVDPIPLCMRVDGTYPSQDAITVDTQEVFKSCQGEVQAFPGHGQLKDGVLRWAGGACQFPPSAYKLEFGGGYLGAQNQNFCGEITVYWLQDCKIGAVRVHDFNQGLDVFGAYHSPTKIADPSFPFEVSIDPPGTCDCPNMVPGCCEVDPGSHNLIVEGKKVPVGVATYVQAQSTTWFNYRTYMPPECVNDPAIVPDAHWSAAHDAP